MVHPYKKIKVVSSVLSGTSVIFMSSHNGIPSWGYKFDILHLTFPWILGIKLTNDRLFCFEVCTCLFVCLNRLPHNSVSPSSRKRQMSAVRSTHGALQESSHHHQVVLKSTRPSHSSSLSAFDKK